MARWLHICQACWEARNPDQYYPDEPRNGYEQGCHFCGDEFALSVNVPANITFTVEEPS